MTLNEFKTHMVLMNWGMKVLPEIDGEKGQALMWEQGDDTVWWSQDMDGKWSFLHAPHRESVMNTYYTFEAMLEVLNERERAANDTFRRLHAR